MGQHESFSTNAKYREKQSFFEQFLPDAALTLLSTWLKKRSADFTVLPSWKLVIAAKLKIITSATELKVTATDIQQMSLYFILLLPCNLVNWLFH